jgi:hypothetical protein
VRTIFAANASPARRKRRYQFMFDFTLVVALIVAALCVTNTTRFTLFYGIPFIVTQVNSGYFAWLTHAPARIFEDDPSKSMNPVGNWLNFFVFNSATVNAENNTVRPAVAIVRVSASFRSPPSASSSRKRLTITSV